MIIITNFYERVVPAPYDELALDALRREAEACDFFGGCFLFHSLAGGSGSGLGSRLLEGARGLFPKASLVSVAVLAAESGETPLQNYNTCLALSVLQEQANAAILF